MKTTLNSARQPWRSLAVAGCAAVTVGSAILGMLPAEAAVPAVAAPSQAQKSDPNTPVARSSSGRTVVGGAAVTRAAGARAAGSSVSAFRGTGKLSSSRGVNVKRKFPPNAKMLKGAVRPMSVIGADGRTRVTETSTYPNSVVDLLTFEAPNGSTYKCTAWLYDNDTVGTAGHCVYFHDNATNVHGWNRNFEFWPGADNGLAPFGSCGSSTAHSVSGWINNQKHEYDYGAIKLNCTIGNTTGWYGITWQSASYNGTSVDITGYPVDKPTETMWQMSGSIASSDTRQLLYSIDTYGGQSGAAVRTSGCGAYCAIGVHTKGPYGGSPYNRGTRITQSTFNNFVTWSQ